MIRIGYSMCAVTAVCVAVIAVSTMSAAWAADASGWVDDSYSAVRLISGSGQSAGGARRAGIEIRMKPGWKTYWRYPGDAGIPPKFDFSGSGNLAAVRVLWPAPHAYTDEAGASIGYKDRVVFPLSVTPLRADKPVTLALKINYAVCEKLCVPAQGAASLTLDGKASVNDALLAAAEAQIPHKLSAVVAGLTVRRVGGTGKPQVALEFSAPDEKARDVFVEGPTADWALPLPKAAPGAAKGRRLYSLVLDGLPSGIDPNSPFDLTITIVGGQQPVEITTRLD